MKLPEGESDDHTRDVSREVLDMLKDFFTSHGARVQEDRDCLILDQGRLYAFAVARLSRSKDQNWRVRADFGFILGGGEEIREALAGFGDEPSEAMNNLFRNALDSVLHVIFATFLGHGCDHFDQDVWAIRGVQRTVHCGWWVIRGRRPPGLSDAIYRALQAALERCGPGEGLHWLRIFFAQAGSQPPVIEALLDNEPSSELMDEVAAFPWPRVEKFYSIRMFMIFPV